MTFGLIVLYILGVLLGVLLGLFIAKFLNPKVVGNLRVDRSDPDDRPYLFLEIFPGKRDSILTDDYITLRIRRENYISRD